MCNYCGTQLTYVPSSQEQQMLELVNRARLDPLGEIDRYNAWNTDPNKPLATLNDGLAPGTISSTAKQPLAFDGILNAAAAGHSAWMLANNQFVHDQPAPSDSDGVVTHAERIFRAGWDGGSNWATGENISFAASTVAGYASDPATILQQHFGLFQSFGHRKNILSDRFSEIGVGHEVGAFTTSNGTTFTSTSMITQKFADAGRTYITGVVIDDVDGDDFYDIGEGLGFVLVTATGSSGTFQTATWASGGYTLEVPDGAYSVTFEGGALPGPVTKQVTVAGASVKVDAEVADAGGNLLRVGTDNADVLFGGIGDDTILGVGGDDRMRGGPGNDAIDGGPGSDTAVFVQARADFFMRSFMSGDGRIFTQVTDLNGYEGVDTLVGVEVLDFAGRAYGLAGIQQNATANMNGGAFNDILFQNTSTGALYFVDTGPGGGAMRALLEALPAGWVAQATGDLGGNGTAEVIVKDPTGDFYTYQQGGGWFSGATLTTDWNVLGVGDFTGDGTLDAVAQNATNGVNYFYDPDPGGGGSWGVLPNVGFGWRIVGFGDMDRDGVSDMVVQEIATGVTYYANMDAGGVQAGWGFVAGGLGTTWVAKGVGDMNGDGYDDVVFRNGATGQIWAVDMLGGTNAGWIVATDGVGPNWDVGAVVDHDNDGFDDVIIRETTTGETFAVDVDAGAFAGLDMLTGAMGSDWALV